MTGVTTVVTGAGSGIGQATVLRLASAGSRVIAADLHAEAAAETAHLADGDVSATAVDIRDEESVRELVAVAERAGGVRAIVNVAGIGSTSDTPGTSQHVWDDVMAVNARGTFLCCKHAIPRMIERGGGEVVNVASVAALVGLRNRAAYCASKGAVVALTRALALDHVADGIRVNCVCPGTIDSPWVRRLVHESGESLDALRQRPSRAGAGDRPRA
jgi:NAD(P)-dependent dehydrogenase (short-subunit alcohol dehydrogenase family)